VAIEKLNQILDGKELSKSTTEELFGDLKSENSRRR